jgi:hypothetical protein
MKDQKDLDVACDNGEKSVKSAIFHTQHSRLYADRPELLWAYQLGYNSQLAQIKSVE